MHPVLDAEVLRCEPHSESADMYSYGVVLWELITGKVPWENLSPMQVGVQGGRKGVRKGG